MPSTSKSDGPPSAAQVRRTLGPALPAWEALLDPARGRTTEWKRYGEKHPWSLRVNEGKRTVLWIVPEEGRLRVAVILGEKAVAKGLAGPSPRSSNVSCGRPRPTRRAGWCASG